MVDQKQFENTVDHLLAIHNDEELTKVLESTLSQYIAHCINHFSHGKRKIFRLVPEEKKMRVFWELNNFSRKYIVFSLSKKDIYALIHGLDSDDAADVVYLLPTKKRKAVLSLLTIKESDEIKEILEYPENSAGHIMQKELVKVPEHFSVLDAIKRVQRVHHEVKDIAYVFVTNVRGVFIGSVSLEQLIIHKPNVKIETLITRKTSIPVTMDQEEVAHIFKRADLSVLPVVDEDGKLVGRITADDVVDVLEEEQSEDMYQMAGVQVDEGIFDPPVLSAKRRLPWLSINMMTAILAASVVALFQGTIQKFVVLAVYMPIVAGMGGNAATQTITILVRSIALKQVHLKDLWHIVGKEFLIGAMNGVALGVMIAVISYLFNGNIMLGVVIGLAMIINLIIACVSATIIPLILKALRLDPALASSVFVTTCTDIGGFVSFLGLATLLL